MAGGERTRIDSVAPSGHFQEMKSALKAVALALAPAAWTALHLVVWIPISRYVWNAPERPGAWVFLLVLPAVLCEVVFTRFFDWPAATTPARRLRHRLAAVGRMVVLLGYFWLMVVNVWLKWGTPDPRAPLLVLWPGVAWMALSAVPAVGLVVVALVASVYLAVTVRHRRLRFTTTWFLPAAAAIGLFQVAYHAPDVLFGLVSGQDPAPADLEEVLPGDMGESRAIFGLPIYPRDIYVTPDDTFLVATFGATFGRAKYDRPNFAWVDLTRHTFGYEPCDVVRRFATECPERVYAVPWHHNQDIGASELLELDRSTGRVQRYPLPAERNGFPLEEVNGVYHACDLGRVFIANSRNPTVIEWDTSARKVSRIIDLVGRYGIRMGDSMGPMTRNTRLGRLYFAMVHPHQILEMDDHSGDITRLLDLPSIITDVHVDAQGRWLYLPTLVTRRVWKVDADSLQVVAQFEGPLHCRKLVTSLDGRLLFAAGYFDGTLQVRDTVTGALLLRLRVAPKIEGMYATQRYLYLSSARGVFRLRIERLAQMASGRPDAPPD